MIDRYDDDWARLGWVMVRGTATLLQPGEARHREAVTLLRARYPQYETMALESAPMIMLTPTQIRSWGALD